MCDLLEAAGLARSSYYYALAHPKGATRAHLRPKVAQIFSRTPTGVVTGRWPCAEPVNYSVGLEVGGDSIWLVTAGIRWANVGNTPRQTGELHH